MYGGTLGILWEDAGQYPMEWQILSGITGGEVRLGTVEKEIMADRGSVTGIRLNNGEEISGRALVSNAG